uniref:RNA-binding S4 domain-containing protein n=1 Tax=Heliothis virescens TaxID=7102 RepID=A0A2A4JKS7_HELVI
MFTGFNVVRWKSKKSQYDSDDEEVDFEGDSSLSKDSKVVKFNTTSMRTDVILKSALGVSRNKVEQMFYESKIRVNGKKIMKKSASLKLGDEIDVIKIVSPKNPDHIYVSRVEIMNVVPKEESIQVTARRFKHLLIENYEDDPHRASMQNE